MKNVGIHITDFNDNIIDYISKSDGALFNAQMSMNEEEKKETFDFTILSERAENMRERNRVIAQDNNCIFREFIITHVVDNFDGTTDIESNASYFEDINNAKPIKPGKYSAYSTSQALRETLANTGWELSDETEHGGMRTTSWTSYVTPYDLIYQLGTTYTMVPDFYIELGSHTVEHRYVSLKKSNSLFKGKEITKGKDLTEMTRTTDMSEIKTALYAIGPEKDDGTRLEIIVKDDEAQQQFGLPGRYLWGVYEPESDDSEMTSTRLTTLAKTELNKVNKAAISYEVGSTDIHKHYEDIPVFLRDTVRIKDRDFRPALYIEAEVTGIEYDFIDDESTFTFGNIKEYDEASLRESFNKRLDSIQKKVNDNFSNVNTIVRDVVAGELEFYERKIIKSAEQPTNPVNDTLWYDTSNPNVAVLRRYWNGEWLEETADDVEKIGGVTREKALYSELTNTFTNLTISHSKLQSELYDILSSEYLVDEDLKNRVNTEYEKTAGIFNSIYENLNSMTPETATIGKLVDTQSLFLKYREQLQNLYTAVQNANVAINKRFKLLQSQYTDEKFNEALSKVADKFGFEVSPDGLLVGDSTLISGVIQALKEDTEERFKTVVKKADYEKDQNNIVERLNTADTERVQLSDQISDRVTLTEYNNGKVAITDEINNAVDNIQLGGRNLLKASNIPISSSSYVIKDYYLTDEIADDTTVTISIKGELAPGKTHFSVYNSGGIVRLVTLDHSMKQADGVYRATFKWKSKTNAGVKVSNKYIKIYHMSSAVVETSNIEWVKLEYGNKATDWSPAPNDSETKLTTMETAINQNGRDISLRATTQAFNESRKTLSNVIADFTMNTTTGLTLSYDENGAISSHTVDASGVKIRGDKVDITVNKAFQVLTTNVDNKVGIDEVVNRLNLSNEGLDINVNKIGIRGGDSTNNLTIKNNEVLSRGKYSRTWSGVTDKPNATVGIRNGYIMSSNEDTGYNLYMTEKGLSTMMSGGIGSEQAGALEFHFDLMNDNSRGVRLSSTYGVVFLQSEHSRVYTRSRYTTNIETWEGSIYLRPWTGGRTGVNEFAYYVKENDSPQYTDGVLLYGEISNEANVPGYGNAGSGIRFRKAGMPTETKGDYEPIIYATNNQGDIGTGSFYGNRLYGDWSTKTDNLYACVNDKLRVTDFNGYNSGNTNYKDLQVRDIQANSIRVNTGSNLYLGTSTGEVRVTNNLLYNGGNIGYKPIKASGFNNASLVEYKENIQKWDYDALNTIVNETDLYSFNYKSDKTKELNHGLIIGEGYKTPSDLVSGDGVNLYAMTTWAFRAIQQLNEKIKILEEQLNGK